MASSPTSTRSPPSPSASFYDLSDDEEGEYNTIRHTETGRGVKLLYTKSKVRLRLCSLDRDATANDSLRRSTSTLPPPQKTTYPAS